MTEGCPQTFTLRTQLSRSSTLMLQCPPFPSRSPPPSCVSEGGREGAPCAVRRDGRLGSCPGVRYQVRGEGLYGGLWGGVFGGLYGGLWGSMRASRRLPTHGLPTQ